MDHDPVDRGPTLVTPGLWADSHDPVDCGPTCVTPMDRGPPEVRLRLENYSLTNGVHTLTCSRFPAGQSIPHSRLSPLPGRGTQAW